MVKNNCGIHLTIDIENCDEQKLVDNKFIYRLLNDLPSKLNMHSITLPHVVEWKDKWSDTSGLSGFVIIAESHIAIHTFPEQRFTFVDIFSCKNFKAKEIADKIINELGSDKAITNIIKRGKNFILK